MLCHYAKLHYAVSLCCVIKLCHYAVCHIFVTVMLSVIMGGAEVRISGGSYKRSFVYLLLVEERRIQYTISYTFLL